MATVDGAYDCVAKTPMGDQNGVFPLVQPVGEIGEVAGDVLTWKMEMTMPMPMTLECEATVSGDAITGTMQLGAFGASAFTGTRRA